ncbi:MAG: AAA family ATPase [Acidaminococcaceae bacterium]|nr:AAA family ATPase [Acidaminococcaceae bacterium]
MASELKIFTAQALKEANPQPPQFIIDKVLPAGFVMFAAPPKTGKSWLCLSIADAIAEGHSFWGFQTVKGSVLYLALEDSDYRLNSRLNLIGSRRPPNLQLAIHGADTIGAGLIEQMSKWADENNDARLIVIDTLGRVKGAGKPGMNAYENDTLMFSPLQQFAVKRKLCIVGVTHFSKAKNISLDDPFERITGSMGAFGVADAAWILYGKRGEEQTLKITGRDITDADYKVKFENFTWELIGNSEELENQRRIDEYKRSGLVKTICALVQQQGFWEGTATQLLNEVCEREKYCPITNTRDIGKYIRLYREQLEAIDGIGYYQKGGGRKGRAYRFNVVKPPLL